MSKVLIEKINDPLVFVALRRVAIYLIENAWKTSFGDHEHSHVLELSKEHEQDIYIFSQIDTDLNWGQAKIKHADGWSIKNIGDLNPWYAGDLTLEGFVYSLTPLYDFISSFETRFEDVEFIHYFQFLQTYLYEDSIDFWSLLHPKVTEVSQTKFRLTQYADSVRSAFVELENTVKGIVKERTGQDLSGVNLMQVAFSPNNPVIKLGDISNRIGLDIQKGYMEMYCGAMTGIRNPKSHKNYEINKNQATHLLFLASLLMKKIDESRQANQ